jgi:hypothetical protein
MDYKIEGSISDRAAAVKFLKFRKNDIKTAWFRSASKYTCNSNTSKNFCQTNNNSGIDSAVYAPSVTLVGKDGHWLADNRFSCYLAVISAVSVLQP